MTEREALELVRARGVVLQAARGPVPSLAEIVAGGPIRGSWWGHRKGHEIFRLATAVADSPDVLVCRLVDGRVTYVHRRLWPALVRLAPEAPAEGLSAVSEEHTPSGRHRSVEVPFPEWVPEDVRRAAAALTAEAARAQLEACLPWPPPPPPARRRPDSSRRRASGRGSSRRRTRRARRG